MSDKKRLSKKERLRRKKMNKNLRIAGIAMSVIQLIASIVFMVFLHIVSLLPVMYEVLVGVVLVLLVLFVFITQRWKMPGIATKIMSLMLIVVLIVGSVYVNATYNAISKMSGDKVLTTKMNVYVMADSPINDVNALVGKACGKLGNADQEMTNNMIEHIAKDKNVTLKCEDFVSVAQLAGALYGKSVEAIVLNESYVSILEQLDGYEDFLTKTKVVYTKDFETVVEVVSNDKIRLNQDVMAVYLSGIDVEGEPTASSRSDVNIIAIVNFKTHQVLLLNTPRDYYIPLSISNGYRDKLTHAGAYGVDVSMDTLGMLYGINVDYYVRVNFTGFVDIVDELGGITVHSDYDFVTHHGGDHIVVGENKLTGIQALGFARERYSFSDGDNQRGKNNMLVIKAIVDKATSPAMLSNYTNILSTVSKHIVTDMPYSEISNIAQIQVNENPKWDIQSYAVSGTGAMKTTYSAGSQPLSVMIPDEKTVAIAKSLIENVYNSQIIDVDAVVGQSE